MPHELTGHLALPMRAALIWKLAEALCRRRRPGIDLSVTILRPGGGQYFCVTLGRRDDWKPVVMMNVAGTSLETTALGEPRTRIEDLPWHRDGYQAALLTRSVAAVADDIEALLGLPPWRGPLASTSAALLGVRLVSAVMQRTIFSPQLTIADAGYLDSSGGGSGVQPWVARFPDVHAKAVAARDDWMVAARHASRIWRLGKKGSERAVLLDLGAGVGLTDGELCERAQLFREYQRNGGRLAPLVEWIVERLEV